MRSTLGGFIERIVEAAQVLVQPDEDLLRGVLGVFPAAEQVERREQHAAFVAKDDLLERGPVARPGVPEQPGRFRAALTGCHHGLDHRSLLEGTH